MMGVHEHEGQAMHTTSPLTSDDAVDIEVTLLGFGLSDDEANWTSPTGEVIYFNVVPEFGTFAAMILAIAIISIVTVSARSKLSIMPRL
ncbi:MAG: PEFG-CTERM sorting domain-containing protein [Nitrosopumilus sp.]